MVPGSVENSGMTIGDGVEREGGGSVGSSLSVMVTGLFPGERRVHSGSSH